MNVNLYCVNDTIHGDNMITFCLLDTINSIKIFIFKMEPATTSTHLPMTRLVSGYEKGSRNTCMRMECVSSCSKNAYIISCVRLPYLSSRLVNSKQFTVPVSPVIVRCDGETQIWHVFGVCKGKEMTSIARVNGVTTCVRGREEFVSKELISLTGNLPASFISAITHNSVRAEDVPLIRLLYPDVIINDEDVVIVKK
ncbi:hypothetical protein KM622_gp133 [Spodoptera exempta nucleopolyhedrovirus]|uniref:EP23 n=1 Tax=Spodoptera exempta nucleopolyhedrovirus TaxID=1242863 RepID=A0A410S7W9_9ABAC|nr:hypothetical protein KM622_gp133 [Spodoptera exempta nucleopolyhedrovirus]QAT90424.1 hypothetical protein [Spodoptera exempta nucleopolyhedrovirus]